jgi:hypothetical protein
MRGHIEQALADRIKVLRSAVRLKHSIAADRELNILLDAERKKFFKSVQQGKLPEAINVEKVFSG